MKEAISRFRELLILKRLRVTGDAFLKDTPLVSASQNRTRDKTNEILKNQRWGHAIMEERRRANERTNERRNERRNEPSNETEWKKTKGTNEWTNKRTNKQTNKWTNEQTNKKQTDKKRQFMRGSNKNHFAPSSIELGRLISFPMWNGSSTFVVKA